jgi:5-dehydro-4-deoxyglucarate dehydratase
VQFDSVLYFPVTPFDSADRVNEDVLREHLASRVGAGAGGVFPACGTGEFHALTVDEVARVVRITVEEVAGRVPVVAGTGGQYGNAVALARLASEAGADALLVLPPYLVSGPQEGLARYIEGVAAASDLPVIVYHRGTAQYSVGLVERLVRNPKIIGFKDGVGDLALAQAVALAVAASGRTDFRLFNGLLTAELSQGAYRGVGIPLYSSAAFAMAPDVALAYYRAYISGDEQTRLALLRVFYSPLVALRDETPGFGVSLVKAGLRLAGLDVGSVRPPLVDPSPAQTERLAQILEAGRVLVAVPAPA